MTPRERFLASLHGRRTDRFFRYEHGPWPATRQRWIAEGFPRDADFRSHFRMDPLVTLPVNSGYTGSPYCPPFEETVREETREYRIYTDRDGVLKKELRVNRDTSMPQFLKFPVACRKDWEGVRTRLDPADAPARVGDPARLLRLAASPEVPVNLQLCGAFGHPRNLLGDEGLSCTLYDDPALLEEILDNWRDLYVALIKEVTRHVSVDSLLVWEDMCFRNGPLISPAHFRRFMLPRYVAVLRVARECGVGGVIVDTDGDCRKLIPIFLEAGVDCLMPFEVQAGMDVIQVRKEYPALGILGGLDKRVLARDRASIRAEVDRVLPRFLDRGGYIPALDHTVPPDVPLANFEYYLECVRRHESGGG